MRAREAALRVTEALVDFAESWEAYSSLGLPSLHKDSISNFDKLSYSFALWATAHRKETMVEYPEVTTTYAETINTPADVPLDNGDTPVGVQPESGGVEEVPERDHSGDLSGGQVLGGMRTVTNTFTICIPGPGAISVPLTLGPGTYTISISSAEPLAVTPTDATSVPVTNSYDVPPAG